MDFPKTFNCIILNLFDGITIFLGDLFQKMLHILIFMQLSVHVSVHVVQNVLEPLVVHEDVDCDHGVDGEDDQAVQDREVAGEIVQGGFGPGDNICR